jgi:hypothetical protein
VVVALVEHQTIPLVLMAQLIPVVEEAVVEQTLQIRTAALAAQALSSLESRQSLLPHSQAE